MSLGIRCIFSHCQKLCNNVEAAPKETTERPSDLLHAFASPSLTQNNRAFRLHWGSARSSLE
ncbi:hypothetical protein LMG28727_03090 [Paraburkholderia kirstenboschensis]|nr:hypothetical protein LMG28727_03090 [Paraburkholderia kirstenboschensis]